jgi:hypothetical protein
MILTNFRISKDPNTGKLTLTLQRDYPSSYLEADRFVLEKYELPLSDPDIRQSLRDAIKSQTVLQYMSDYLMMSASFWIVPINNYEKLEVIRKAADFRMNPILLDISEFIKNQNSIYIDEETKPDHLYLYRIVYDYQGVTYHTPYVAGFERISSSLFLTETTDRELYKPLVSDETMERLFGSHWSNLKKYFWTEISETRSKYNQDPLVFKIPGRRVNARYRGPLEDYKLILSTRETDRHVQTLKAITSKVQSEQDSSLLYMREIINKSIRFHAQTDQQKVLFNELIENIAGDDLFAVLLKTDKTIRVMEITGLADSHLVADLIRKRGVYILLKTMTNAEQLYNALLQNRYGIEDSIFIALYNGTEVTYTIPEVF